MDGARSAFGDVAAATERAVARAGSGKLAMAFAKFYPDGLPAFLDRLRAEGQGEAVDAWLGGDTGRSVPAAVIAACLPEAVTARLADDLSLPPGRVPVSLAEFLPAAVAKVSEGGRLKPQPNFSTQIR
ncbi:YidB family protein [Methylobacterium sp. NEAU 140]|uniref:YidB family protein n=1 Tax=Methylobacterium sp. NEAU 140 TaxID=3064945 RepID=UPI002734D49E|nr:YidB family protein [Methylobacterium sp. NEAU 140]MDP4023866.1 YidB family protein [Methylobacterium sp. NEAU 140]